MSAQLSAVGAGPESSLQRCHMQFGGSLGVTLSESASFNREKSDREPGGKHT